ncbi:Uncharacterized protein BM_BM17598 [Brugia malayi]|uniref:Uncharacterized protein n=1 Tax=Brugia malayi TaxID=6279 RepID=A0A4E9FEI3_BRUMA|nr:Uncharacterized protein BM_BM17598 [Brugia malayi]VIO95345.1 Uncharacterized protein BM_BM17598 [Brugia malayi]
MLLLIFLYFGSTDCRDCVDSVKGICETNNLFGWCFHDKISGLFDCDKSKYCSNQESLRRRLNSTGCFDRGNDNIKCCCNEANSDGSEAILRGCQSRALKRLKIDRQIPVRIANRVYFDDMDDLLEQPRCDQFVDKTDIINDTTIACLDLYSKQYNERKIGKLCCCRGNDACNDKIGDNKIISKTIDNLKFVVEKMSSKANCIYNICSSSIIFILLFAFCFFFLSIY